MNQHDLFRPLHLIVTAKELYHSFSLAVFLWISIMTINNKDFQTVSPALISFHDLHCPMSMVPFSTVQLQGKGLCSHISDSNR